MESTASTPASIRRLPRAITLMRAFSRSRQQQVSTVISAPIGPVKSSRGADLTRSDTLTIVAGIDSETHEGNSKKSYNPEALERSQIPITTRSVAENPNLGQGLSTGPNGQKSVSLAGKSTVASSNIMATASTAQNRSPKQSATSRRLPLKASISVPLLEQVESPKSACLSITALSTVVQDENMPPTTDNAEVSNNKIQIPDTSRKTSRLPKSRTVGVLHELKASIQRPRTVYSRARRGSQLPAPCFKDSPSTDSGKTALLASATSSRVWLSHSSLTSLVRSSRSCTPEPIRPDQVVSAQPSAYWSGRFLALHDRFLSEAQERLASSTWPTVSREASQSPATSLRDRASAKLALKNEALNGPLLQLPFSSKAALPHANTTSSLSKIMFKPAAANGNDEDDDRCRRIFTRLEGSCLTTEAKQSLLDWQHSYARRVNRPSLLPSGRAMDEKSRVARFFSGSSAAKKHQRQRQSLSGVSNLEKNINRAAAVFIEAQKK